MFKLLFSMLCLIVITGCATYLEQGNSALNQKNYKKAAGYYYQCGKQGDPNCINNLGVVHMKLGNKNEAIEHYILAARFGQPDAIRNLTNLGEPLPAQDLVRLSPGHGSLSTTRNSQGYKSSFGRNYQYDLSRPIDQIRYDVDERAKLRDSLDIDPRRGLERDLGEIGAGVYR